VAEPANHHRLGLRVLRACAVCAWLVGLSSHAQAYDNVRAEIDANRSIVSSARATAAEAISNAQATARIRGSVTMPAPGGGSASGVLGVTVSARGVAAIAARAAARASLPISAAVTIMDLMDRARLKPDEVPGGEGLMWDEGTPPSVVNGYCKWVGLVTGVNGAANWPGGNVCAATEIGLSHAQAAVYQQTGRVVYNISTHEFWYYYDLNSPTPSRYQVSVYYQSRSSNEYCPDVIDPLDPSKSIYGASKDIDGKCPTGRYTKPMTAQEFADSEVTGEIIAGMDYANLVREAIGLDPIGVTLPQDAGEGNSTMGIEEGSVQPSVIHGPTTVTETPTQTEAIGFDYIPDPRQESTSAITDWKKETTKTTTNKETGETTTETTTETPPDGEDPLEEESDPCEEGSERLGCVDLGDPPEEETPKRQWDASWTAEAVGLPAYCPPPRSVAGQSVSWQETCDAAEGMAPFIRIGAAWAALMLVLATLRGA
jgi:hypothetical protein